MSRYRKRGWRLVGYLLAWLALLVGGLTWLAWAYAHEYSDPQAPEGSLVGIWVLLIVTGSTVVVAVPAVVIEIVVAVAKRVRRQAAC